MWFFYIIISTCTTDRLENAFLFSPQNLTPLPSNVKLSIRSSTSIMVEWGYVPAADQNGIILSYTITYLALPGGSPQIKLVNAPTTKATLTGLNELTNYSVTVFASTVKGDGNVSEPLTIRIDEDSRFSK